MAAPMLRAALICEKLLVETDGVMSPIRVFNKLEISPGLMVNGTLLVMLVTSEATATPDHHVLLRVENDAGDVINRERFEVTSPLEAGRTFSLIVPFRFEAPPLSGNLWLRFAYDTDEQLLTRVPLEFDVRAAVSA